MRLYPHNPMTPPKTPPPNTITLGVEFQHIILGRHKHSVYCRHPPGDMELEGRGEVRSGDRKDVVSTRMTVKWQEWISPPRKGEWN